MLVAEAKSLIPTLFGEESLELILGRVMRQIPNIQRVAWWVLIRRIDWRIVQPMVLGAGEMKSRVGTHVGNIRRHRSCRVSHTHSRSSVGKLLHGLGRQVG